MKTETTFKKIKLIRFLLIPAKANPRPSCSSRQDPFARDRDPFWFCWNVTILSQPESCFVFVFTRRLITLNVCWDRIVGIVFPFRWQGPTWWSYYWQPVKSEVPLMIATTDVAAPCLNIPDVEYVINFLSRWQLKITFIVSVELAVAVLPVRPPSSPTPINRIPVIDQQFLKASRI